MHLNLQYQIKNLKLQQKYKIVLMAPRLLFNLFQQYLKKKPL